MKENLLKKDSIVSVFALLILIFFFAPATTSSTFNVYIKREEIILERKPFWHLFLAIKYLIKYKYYSPLYLLLYIRTIISFPTAKGENTCVEV